MVQGINTKWSLEVSSITRKVFTTPNNTPSMICFRYYDDNLWLETVLEMDITDDKLIFFNSKIIFGLSIKVSGIPAGFMNTNA